MTASSLTPDSILAALGDLLDPDNRRPLKAQGLIRDVKVENGVASLTLALTTHASPLWNKLKADAVEKLRSRLPELQDVKVDVVVHDRPPMELGKIGLRAKSVIAVGSGKGGVGKSTLCACLAFGMAKAGCKVGLMDADVYGPSVPHMLGGGRRPEIVERTAPDGTKVKRIIPIEARGLKVMSMGFLLDPEQAVVWRGPMLHGAITQFLRDVEWGDLDYLFIDLPPGTGDIALTLSQLLPLTGAVVVCTPQDVALIDAVRAVSMFRQVHIPVLGMVENMSFFLCPDNG
ncbi:MAG TPA: Mrp/NBP35 family ATP-binding protein, partial [Pirellulales bacterium]